MGNTASVLGGVERYPHHLNLSQDEIAQIHSKVDSIPLSVKRKNYYCKNAYVPSTRIVPWELDTIKAMYSTLPLIREELKEQARQEQHEKLRKEREALWVEALRDELRTITARGAEFDMVHDAVIALPDARLSGVLALANFNLNCAARCLCIEIKDQKILAQFKAKLVEYNRVHLRSHPLLAFPKDNQINALLHGELRTEEQALHVWQCMCDLNYRIYEKYGVTLPFNQNYKLLRTAGFNLETAYAYHTKDVTAYRELKRVLLRTYHNNNPVDYDMECARTMLRRCDYSVQDTVEMYGNELKRRTKAVAELRHDLVQANVKNICSDRALYYHLVRCYWDLGLAKEAYDVEVIGEWERDDKARNEGNRKNYVIHALAKNELSMQKENMKGEHASSTTSVQDSNGANTTDTNGRMGEAEEESLCSPTAEVLIPTNTTTGVEEQTVTAEEDSYNSQVLTGQMQIDDDYGIEPDVDFVGVENGKTSSEEAVVKQLERQMHRENLLMDAHNRDVPIWPLGAPFEPQTEVNKLISVMQVDCTTIEADALVVFLPYEDLTYAQYAQSIIKKGGPRLEQELKCARGWHAEKPLLTAGYNICSKWIMWVPCHNTIESVANAVDHTLHELKSRGWKYMVYADIAECLPNILPHRARHMVGCRTRMFLEIVGNRRTLDFIIVAHEDKQVYQAWLRTFLMYYPGPNMQTIVGIRFAREKELHKSALECAEFKQEIANMVYTGPLPEPPKKELENTTDGDVPKDTNTTETNTNSNTNTNVKPKDMAMNKSAVTA